MSSTLPAPTQSQLQLPAPIKHGQSLRFVATTTKSPLLTHFDACLERISFMAECQATFNGSERVPELEDALREIIDAQNDTGSMRSAVATVMEDHAAFRVPADTGAAILEAAEVMKGQFRDLSAWERYGTNKAFDEFKRRVFDIERPEEDYPGTASFFQGRRVAGGGADGGDGNNEDEDDDDGFEMTYRTKRNLKCPITMMTFEHPLRSKVCVHIYSRDAVMEMLRRNRGTIKCPVAGCDATLTATSLVRDRVTERRVRDGADKDDDGDGEAEHGRGVGEELSSDAAADVLDVF